MKVQWYRLCFDPRPSREGFSNGREFEEWANRYFGAFDFRSGGYLILPWHESINSVGQKIWNIIVPAEQPNQTYRSIIEYLLDNEMVIDDCDVVVMTKYFDGGEPITHRGMEQR